MNNRYIVFAAIGFELVGVMLACLFIGQWVDETYGTKGLGVLGLSILGLTGWMVHMVRLLKMIEKAPQEDSKNDQPRKSNGKS